jgi:hypothetical protein
MDADQSFLYGVVALQVGLVDSQHSNEVIHAMEWDAQRDGPFADHLIQPGWIRPGDRAHLTIWSNANSSAGDTKPAASVIVKSNTPGVVAQIIKFSARWPHRPKQ